MTWTCLGEAGHLGRDFRGEEHARVEDETPVEDVQGVHPRADEEGGALAVG
jgi:hypothetical protein